MALFLISLFIICQVIANATAANNEVIYTTSDRRETTVPKTTTPYAMTTTPYTTTIC